MPAEEAKARVFCEFLWRTGTRVSEALAVTRGDVDFQNEVVRIRTLKVSQKDPARHRLVPIPGFGAHLATYAAKLTLEGLLFPFTRQRAYQVVRRWLQCHPHTLRHSYAVHLLRSGLTLPEVQALLGHRYITTTLIYTRIVQADTFPRVAGVRF